MSSSRAKLRARAEDLFEKFDAARVAKGWKWLSRKRRAAVLAELEDLLKREEEDGDLEDAVGSGEGP